jgi:hypothetical protein
MANIGITCRISACFAVLLLVSCSRQIPPAPAETATSFDPKSLTIKENSGTKRIHGQVLYLPVYSNIPTHPKKNNYDLSAFIAIHNTDLYNPIKITRVLYFNNDGKLVHNYLKQDTILNPLAATNFFVSEIDKSGTGANFIVEWKSDSLVYEPLIESVMIGLTNGEGLSYLSNGRVIRELK